MSNIQTKHIVAYGLFEYTQLLQQAFDEGFRVDLEDNLRAPNSFGAIMEVTLVKEEKQQPKQPETKDVSKDDTVDTATSASLEQGATAKRGRKAST